MNGIISGRKPSAQNGGASAKLREERDLARNVDLHLSVRISPVFF